MPDIYLTEALKGIELITINDAGTLIDIPSISQQRVPANPPATGSRIIYEEVSAITGTTVAAAHEIVKKGECTIQQYVDRKNGKVEPLLDPMQPASLLRTTVIYDAYITRLNHSRNQIRQYNWVSREQMRLCIKRLCATIPETTGIYEDFVIMPGFDPRVVKSVREISGETRPPHVHGRSDIIVDNRLYEIKAVSILSGTHVAQLLMYYYGYLCAGKRLAMYLYNVLTDELCKIEATDANLLYAMKVLNHAKNHADASADDDAFLAKVRGSSTFDSVGERIARCTKCIGKFERIPAGTEMKH